MYCSSKARLGQILELLERPHYHGHNFPKSRMECKETYFKVLIQYNHIILVFSQCSFGYNMLICSFVIRSCKNGENSVHMGVLSQPIHNMVE